MDAKRRLMCMAGTILLAASLAACHSGSGTPSAGASTKLDGTGKTLDVFMGANTIYPTQQKQWFNDVAAKFKAQTGANVTFETFASANDELTKIQTSVLSGQGPDIYLLGTTFTPTAYATGAFLQLSADDWKKVGGRDRFLPATLGISGPDNDHQVGIPFASRPFVMAYNKDLLAAAGFDPWKFVWAMDVQAGNPVVDGKKARIDDPTSLTAYKTYLGWLANDKVVDPAAVGWKNAQAIAAFGAGKAAFLPMVSASSKVTLDKSSVAGKYAYALMPTIPPGASSLPSGGVAATSILSGDNVVVAKYSK